MFILIGPHQQKVFSHKLTKSNLEKTNFLTFTKLNSPFFITSKHDIYIFVSLSNVPKTLFNISQSKILLFFLSNIICHFRI